MLAIAVCAILQILTNAFKRSFHERTSHVINRKSKLHLFLRGPISRKRTSLSIEYNIDGIVGINNQLTPKRVTNVGGKIFLKGLLFFVNITAIIIGSLLVNKIQDIKHKIYLFRLVFYAIKQHTHS